MRKSKVTQSNMSTQRKTLLNRLAVIFDKVDKILCSSKKSLAFIAVFSVIINILLETSLRQNIFSVLYLIISSPVVFFLGVLIIFATYSFTYLFKKRAFVFSVTTFLWLVIMVVNVFLMCIFQRSTPFNFSDLRIFNTTRDIVNNGYMGVFDVVIIAIVAMFFIGLLVLAYIKCRKLTKFSAISYFFPVQIWAFTLIAIVLYTNFVVSADRFDNLPNKYREHGFAFCFLYSVVDNGIDKPENYSADVYDDVRKQTNKAVANNNTEEQVEIVKSENQQLIDNVFETVVEQYRDMTNYKYLEMDTERAEGIIASLTQKYQKSIESVPVGSGFDISSENSVFPEEFDMPNIIFLQLESFYDVNNIMGYEYSQNPHPVYSMLKEQLPGGKLTVPSIGAGTANTEFEIMTGMDVSFFGIAEYHYLSILQNQTCESIAHNAKEYGYATHVIHNHKGTFYDRYKVFPNLGYDTFTPLESLHEIETNQRNWCKDSMLLDPIIDCLSSSQGKDLIYTISVQPHGKYPSESVYNEILGDQLPRIMVTGNEYNPENPGFTYYVNQLSEVDTFLGTLLCEINALNEPTVLVLYGDHLPSFSVQKYWNLKEGNCYQTDYIIWNNCGLDFSDAKDLTTFQLASYVFSKVGIDSGDINRLNRLYLKNEDVNDYRSLRHTYQYAIFYDNTLKDPTSKVSIPKYQRSDIQYGIDNATLDSIYTIGDTTYITGNGFNMYSKITINGSNVDTIYIDGGTLSTNARILQDDNIGTTQMSGSTPLGNSKNFIIYNDSMIIPETLWDETLDEILGSPVPVNHTPIVEDATLDFVTGNDEMSMVQDDINK